MGNQDQSIAIILNNKLEDEAFHLNSLITGRGLRSPPHSLELIKDDILSGWGWFFYSELQDLFICIQFSFCWFLKYSVPY
ncbi:hypothetical protein CISIN_1g047692mg [Citrus sinensis]|uniref:Uncharacterized protein n=1 Tax=Citrus sinensis TaxID=2711 RepID=A0A067GQG5_CITSI|nr:hypothetical protein CISIN_1g047692mg [Citrus sinensis]